MRMSGSSKVEMSAFIGGRGRYGNGANCLEPTRTGPRSVATESRFLASCDLLRKVATQDTARPTGPSPIETSTKVPLTLARLPFNLSIVEQWLPCRIGESLSKRGARRRVCRLGTGIT
jgi:hypothetical protein